MEDRLSEILTHSVNYIPSGRLLPRSPPMTSVKRYLDFDDAESVMPTSKAEADGAVGVLGCSSPKIENPYSMLKGMKGYHPTPDDLNFIKKKTEEELLKKLQGELAETRTMQEKELKALELATVSRELTLASFNKFPSIDQFSNLVQLVLGETSPVDLTDVDIKSILIMVTLEKIQRLNDEKRKTIAQMEEFIAEKHKKEAEDEEQIKMQLANEKLKIQELMKQLTELKSDLFHLETNAGKEHKDDSEKKLPAAKGKQRCHQTQRKDVNLGENVEKNKSKSRQNHAIKEMNVDRGQAVKEMSRQKFEAAKEGSLEQVKVTRRGKGRTEPLETQLPLPGPRRSKRIANQCKMQD